MFCPRCGNNLNSNEKFCPNCGADIKKIEQELQVKAKVQNSNQVNLNNVNNSTKVAEPTMTEAFSKKTKEVVSPISKNIKNFFSKFKKQILVTTLCLAIIIIAVSLYAGLFGFEKLSWDDTYLAADTKFVMQSNLKLGVKFSNLDKADKIKFTSSCGEVKSDGLEATINLNDATGDCVVEAQYKHKKIRKEFKVVEPEHENRELKLEHKIDEDSDEDLDFDGLTNKQEKEYRTNPEVLDTDMDGLDDNYEIFTSKTDPNKKDTDDDELSDYDEIQLGLDPNKSDSKDDGIKDGNRTLSYDYNSDNVKVAITGTGNIASMVSEVNSNTKISSKTGLIDNLYTLYTSGKVKEATLTIKYTDEELEKYKLNEDNLSIYYYNDKESKYEKIDTIVDKENKVVTAKLEHFSNYVVGDSSLVNESTKNQVLFILDNSWSMYTDEQYTKYTGKDYFKSTSQHLDGFDKNGLRFTLTDKLLSKLSSENYKVGLSEFRRDYANAVSIGSNKDEIKSKLATMEGNFVTKVEGTDIGNALLKGMDEFDESDDNKYIVILTDGLDSGLKSKTKNIIDKAIKNDIKVYSVGFGEGSYNTQLANISNGTGGIFYSSSNATGLTELFGNVGAELNDDLVDINEDNKSDGIVIADNGFVVNRDGFAFSNYSTNLSSGGHCYGMANFVELYYKKALPLKFDSKDTGKHKSYAYDLTNTYFKDYSNLYDFKLKTEAFKYGFGADGFQYFNEELPADYQKFDGEKIVFNDKYKKELNDSGMYDIYEEKSGLSSEKQIEKYGATYELAENCRLNEDKMQTSKVIQNDELQLFNAIYAGFIKQDLDRTYSSGSNLLISLRQLFGTERIDYTSADGFINILKSRLKEKDAPVLVFNGHAVNAISLIQDIDNPNHYYIGVYDNNYPGEKRYVELERNFDTCVTKENKYYNLSGEPIRITLSLEYDLEYYKK